MIQLYRSLSSHPPYLQAMGILEPKEKIQFDAERGKRPCPER
jgi:hypothetical protein